MLEPREGSGPPQQVSLQEGFRDHERHQRWAGLFEQLDTNKDGRVDINELREGLARMGMEASPQAEQYVAEHSVLTSVLLATYGHIIDGP